jgi:hypothetical protein
MAGRAGDHRVSHAPAACRGFPGRCADARLPAHLRLARPQLVTEWAALQLILEQRNGHLNDHARTRRDASMITAAGSEPGPGGVSPGAAIRTGSADRGGRGQGPAPHGPGPRRPRRARSGLAVSLAERPVRLSGEFLGAAVMPRSGHCCSMYLIALGSERDTTRSPVISPTVACPPRRRGQGLGRRIGA